MQKPNRPRKPHHRVQESARINQTTKAKNDLRHLATSRTSKRGDRKKKSSRNQASYWQGRSREAAEVTHQRLRSHRTTSSTATRRGNPTRLSIPRRRIALLLQVHSLFPSPSPTLSPLFNLLCPLLGVAKQARG